MTIRFSLVALAVALAMSGSPGRAQTNSLPPVAVSRQLAEARHLSIGSIVRLSTDHAGARTREFRVVGIYEPTPNPSRLGTPDLEVRFHLPDLLDLTRDADTLAGSESIAGINVALADPADARAFARDVNARLPGVNARPASEATGNSGPFIVLRRFHLAIAAVTIGAATVFLLALTIMLVDERRETVGVLRLIGLPARRILLQVLLEGVMVAAAGAVFGLVLSLASERLINRFFQWRYDTALIFVRITADVALTCVAIAVPLGAAATVIASWALLRRNALRLARR